MHNKRIQKTQNKKVFYEKKFNERKLKSEEKELGATKLETDDCS